MAGEYFEIDHSAMMQSIAHSLFMAIIFPIHSTLHNPAAEKRPLMILTTKNK
jgi:hypothetical protein